MRGIRSSECVARILPDAVVHRLHVAVGQHHVGVEDNHIFACGAFHPVVPGWTRTAVGFVEIPHVKLTGVFFHHVLAGHLRPVFHDDHLKVLDGLPGKAVKEFVNLVGAVEHGHDDRIFRHFFLSWSAKLLNKT